MTDTKCLGEEFFPPYISSEDRVVVVLGAGASISEMMASGASREALPPTDADFLAQSKRSVPRRYREMAQNFEDLWGGYEPRPLKHQRMEMLFSGAFLRVQQTIGTTAAGKKARALYDSLVVLLRDTLAFTTSDPHSEEHYRLLSNIARQNPADLNIVSFNYDVLADRALLRGSRSGEWKWSHADGYGFQPETAAKPRDPSTVNLLKMHGSMNWYIPTPGQSRASVYRSGVRVYVPKPATNPDVAAWSRRHKRWGNSTKRIFPLMVPPVFEKGTQIVGELQQVWAKAEAVLNEATVVIVWGYSLPQTDYHAEVLFSQAARRSKFRLVVINPDRSALAHVTDICGHAWNRWYFSIKHFFAEQGERDS